MTTPHDLLRDARITDLLCGLLSREDTKLAACIRLLDVVALLLRDMPQDRRMRVAETLRDCADAVEHRVQELAN